ncbi:hypothetical protein JB92DRAFT_3108592 [Gautieria morchelliformis]|nr:hypothetical protein JB92DRAFT_3108592 [Gautieria morchelliformis]
MHLAQLLASPHSFLTRVTTQTSLFTPSMTLYHCLKNQTVGQPDTSQGQSSGLLSTSSVPLPEEVAISKLQYMLPVSQLSLDGHLQQALSQKAIDGWQLLNDEGSDEDNSTPEDDMMYGWVPDFEDSSPMELPPTPPPPTLNGQPSTSEGRESMELNDEESPTANQAISATSTAMATRTTKGILH